MKKLKGNRRKSHLYEVEQESALDKNHPIAIELRARLLAARYAKELGITPAQFVAGVKAGKYKLPERPSGGDPNVIPAPDVPGLPKSDALLAPVLLPKQAAQTVKAQQQAAQTIRSAAAPPMRDRLGGQPQADPLSRVPENLKQPFSTVPELFKEFAFKIIKSSISDQDKQQVLTNLSSQNSTNNFANISVLSDELLGRKIGKITVDMQFIADLIIGKKEKAKAIFDLVRETKSIKHFNLLQELFNRKVLSMKELFPKPEEYEELKKSLQENKRYIKLAKILF